MDSGILTQHHTPVQVSIIYTPVLSSCNGLCLIQLIVVLHCFPLTPLIQLYLALLWELWPPSSVRRDSYLQDPSLVPVLTLRLVDSGYPTLPTHSALIVSSLLQLVWRVIIIKLSALMCWFKCFTAIPETTTFISTTSESTTCFVELGSTQGIGK